MKRYRFEVSNFARKMCHSPGIQAGYKNYAYRSINPKNYIYYIVFCIIYNQTAHTQERSR